jgi:REP element-mobilizing transposase RayT
VWLRLRPSVAREVGSLRRPRFISAFRRSLRPACEQGRFRVVHYSIQANHLHLIVEAAGKEALGRGMKSVSARFARAVNRTFARSGPVLHGRYAMRILATQREVRSALAYVLCNARKHWYERFGQAPPVRFDEASSARWFDGWSAAPPPSADAPEVARPRTFFLSRGWRRHGLIRPDEVPGLRRSLRERRRRALRRVGGKSSQRSPGPHRSRRRR